MKPKFFPTIRANFLSQLLIFFVYSSDFLIGDDQTDSGSVIGVTFKDHEALPIIEGFSVNSPARDSGLMVGDRIVSVNGQPVNSSDNFILGMSRIPKGTPLLIKSARSEHGNERMHDHHIITIARPRDVDLGHASFTSLEAVEKAYHAKQKFITEEINFEQLKAKKTELVKEIENTRKTIPPGTREKGEFETTSEYAQFVESARANRVNQLAKEVENLRLRIEGNGLGPETSFSSIEVTLPTELPRFDADSQTFPEITFKRIGWKGSDQRYAVLLESYPNINSVRFKTETAKALRELSNSGKLFANIHSSNQDVHLIKGYVAVDISAGEKSVEIGAKFLGALLLDSIGIEPDIDSVFQTSVRHEPLATFKIHLRSYARFSFLDDQGSVIWSYP